MNWMRCLCAVFTIFSIFALISCGGGSGSGGGGGFLSIQPPVPVYPIPTTGFFTTDTLHFSSGTPDAAVTGYVKNGYYVTRVSKAIATGSVPFYPAYDRYTAIISNLNLGDNQVDLACVTINDGSIVDRKTVTITYNPNLSFGNDRLIASSSLPTNGGFFTRSVVIDADTNLPIAAFDYPREIVFALGDDPAKSVIYKGTTGETKQYDLTTFTEGRVITTGVIPHATFKMGAFILGSADNSLTPDNLLINANTGTILVRSQYADQIAVSADGGFAAWFDPAQPGSGSERFLFHLMDISTGMVIELGNVHIGTYTQPSMAVTNDGKVLVSSFSYSIGNILVTGPRGSNLKEFTGLQDYMGDVLNDSNELFVSANGNPVTGHPATYHVDLKTLRLEKVSDQRIFGLQHMAEGRAAYFSTASIYGGGYEAGAIFTVPGFRRIGKDFMLPNAGNTFSFSRF